MGETISCTDPKDRGDLDLDAMKEVQKQNQKGGAPETDGDLSEGSAQSRITYLKAKVDKLTNENTEL